jgi:ABC-type phosphate/phosphonate transport system permease subunit
VKERWLPVGVLAGVLFATNVVARVVVRLTASNSATNQTRIGLIAVLAVAAVMIGAAYWWALRVRIPRLALDLGVAAVAACALSVLIGPYAAGSRPFAEGGAFLFGQVWQYLVIAAAAALFGLLVAIMLGKDWKSQAWKRYAESMNAKPRRVARR